MNQTSLPQLMSLGDAARYSGLGQKLFTNGVKTGEIPVSIKVIGGRRQRYVSRAELETWLKTWLKKQPADLFAAAEVPA